MAKLAEVAGRGVAEGDAAGDAFEVADLGEQWLQERRRPRGEDRRDRSLACGHATGVPQRRIQPRVHFACAHRRGGVVHDGEQRARRVAVEALVDFQVAARMRIHHHDVVVRLDAHPVDEGQVLAACRLRVTQDGGRGADGQVPARKPEGGEVGDAEVFGEVPEAEIGVEFQRIPVLERRTFECVELVRYEDLRRLHPRKYGSQFRHPRSVADGEVPGRQVQPRDPPTRTSSDEAGKYAVAFRSKQVVLGERPGRHHALHATVHGPLGRCGIADLLADGDRAARLDELGEIAVRGVVGHAGHRDRGAVGASARRQGDVEELGRLLRVVEEQLVEVAHAVEQQRVRVFGLDAQVLLHDRRVVGEGRRHRGTRASSPAIERCNKPECGRGRPRTAEVRRMSEA